MKKSKKNLASVNIALLVIMAIVGIGSGVVMNISDAKEKIGELVYCAFQSKDAQIITANRAIAEKNKQLAQTKAATLANVRNPNDPKLRKVLDAAQPDRLLTKEDFK